MLFGIENSWHLGISEEAFVIIFFHLISGVFVLFFWILQLPITSALECAVQGRNLSTLGKSRVSERSREQSERSQRTFS